MRVKERISAVLLLLVFLFAFFYCLNFPDAPKMMPTLISLVGVLLSIGLLVKSFIFRYSDNEMKLPVMEKKTIVTLGAAIVALIAYVLCITVIGYYVSSFIFIIALAVIIDRTHPWWQYLAVTVGVLVIIYAMFDWFLKVPLPTGLLF